MTDTVLFDLFGVIAHDQASDGRNRLASLAGVSDVGERAFWDAYWQLRPPYDQGLTTGPGYWQQVARSLGTGFDDRQIADLVASDIASWSSVDGAMVDLLGELASSGLRLALLSNIPEELAVHYDSRHAWLDHFELRAYACRIGHAKPAAGRFRMVPGRARHPCRTGPLRRRPQRQHPGRVLFRSAPTCSPRPRSYENSSLTETQGRRQLRPASWPT
ncbi:MULTISPECIES: HAD family hydrolase [unclassified Kitasatospora]|uniref:HAD family hydrolase n=1 Tax=unclassified Kitasatospora TaxID=2633591 RepID=UPI0007C86E3F|nr:MULTISPECIES: hypothetical protein [unclassified Kitasatospora]